MLPSKFSVHLAKRFQSRRFGSAVSEKIFRNRLIRNKNCLWKPCLLTDRDAILIEDLPQMLPTKFRIINLNSLSQRRKFLEIDQSEKKNGLWRPCLVTNRDEMSNLYRGPSKDASYQISVHLAKRFQRRRIFQKSTNQKQELPVAAMFVNGSELNKQSLQRTFQGYFLPSYGSFG